MHFSVGSHPIIALLALCKSATSHSHIHPDITLRAALLVALAIKTVSVLFKRTVGPSPGALRGPAVLAGGYC